MDEIWLAMKKEMWLVRDEEGTLCLYYGYEEPYKDKTHWISLTCDWLELDNDMFPEVKWSDKEPTRVKLVIDK